LRVCQVCWPFVLRVVRSCGLPPSTNGRHSWHTAPSCVPCCYTPPPPPPAAAELQQGDKGSTCDVHQVCCPFCSLWSLVVMLQAHNKSTTANTADAPLSGVPCHTHHHPTSCC
jgi:hypothetical protein